MSDDLSIPNASYRPSRAGRYGSGSRVQPSMDPDTRRLMLFAMTLGAILSILIATSAIVGHRRTDIPVITADPRPIRIKPDNPGGMKIDGADNDLFSGEADNKTAKLAATAEIPDTVALTATGIPTGAHTNTQTSISVPEQSPLSAIPMQADPAAPKPAALAAPPAPAKPAMPKPAATTATTPKPSASPAAKSSVPPAAKPPASVPETHAAIPHPAVVQLAALTSEEAARNEWQQLTKRMPDVLTSHQPSYSRIERDGHTFWRLRTAGFADAAGARGFCDHVRAKGGSCSVADF